MTRWLVPVFVSGLLAACSTNSANEAPAPAPAAAAAPQAAPAEEAEPEASEVAENSTENEVALLRVVPELVLIEENDSLRLLTVAENALGQMLPQAEVRFSTRSSIITVSDNGTITSQGQRGPAFVVVEAGDLRREVPVRVVGVGEMPEVLAVQGDEGSGQNVLDEGTSPEEAAQVVSDTLRGSWDLSLDDNRIATTSFGREGQFEQILPDGTTLGGEWGVDASDEGAPRLWWNASGGGRLESRGGACTDVRPRQVICGDISLRRTR